MGDLREPKSSENGGHAAKSELAKINTAYFYYFDYTGGGPAKIEAYEFFVGMNNDVGDPKTLAIRLAQNAVGNESNPPKYSENVAYLARRRKGYFIIAVEGRQFDSPPMDFICTGSNDPSHRVHDGSHTFDFVDAFDQDIGSGRMVSFAIYMCKMARRRDRGNLEKGEWEDYDLDFHFRGAAAALVPLENGGTNLGPPPPPPAPV